VIAPEYDNQMRFGQALRNLAPPLFPRLNGIDVLEDEGFVDPKKFHNWSDQRRISMAIGDENVCGLVRHRQFIS
jgi:hypothetical protein